jgi:hypothetical protein
MKRGRAWPYRFIAAVWISMCALYDIAQNLRIEADAVFGKRSLLV